MQEALGGAERGGWVVGHGGCGWAQVRFSIPATFGTLRALARAGFVRLEGGGPRREVREVADEEYYEQPGQPPGQGAERASRGRVSPGSNKRQGGRGRDRAWRPAHRYHAEEVRKPAQAQRQDHPPPPFLASLPISPSLSLSLSL